MKINSLSSLQVHTAQKTMFSNGNARFSKADNQDVKSMLAQAIPSVIHHKASESFSALPEVPDGTILVYTRPYDPPEAVNARYEEIGTLFTSKLGAASGDLKVAYEDALSQLPPTIKGKDWGFSVNQHNQIVILEGSDKLSDTEQEIILSVFAKASVGQAAGAVADIVERMLELERMPKGVSNGFGRFDVSRTNFHEVVDLRTYLNSHGPGGPYGQHRVDPFDYAGLFFTGGYAMMEQISAKAEETYINKSLR